MSDADVWSHLRSVFKDTYRTRASLRDARKPLFITGWESMRYVLVLLTVTILADHASGQLISPTGNPPLNRMAVEVASDVPTKLKGNASLTFDSLLKC